MDRIARMHNLTPEQIGIDYDALSKLVPPEHFLKHHSMEEIIRYWVRQHSVQELREIVDRMERQAPGTAISTTAAQELREIIDRIERTTNGPAESAPPQT